MNPNLAFLTQLTYGLILAILVAGCTDHQTSITNTQKANLTKELIIENEKCHIYINQLLNPSVDNLAIEKIYHEATMASCIKKDI